MILNLDILKIKINHHIIIGLFNDNAMFFTIYLLTFKIFRNIAFRTGKIFSNITPFLHTTHEGNESRKKLK